MEEDSPTHKSVAELSRRFSGSASLNKTAGNEEEKPVRRRPPRTLQLPKTHGDNQDPPPDTASAGPNKAKRNSALIEKLQANLVLSPTSPANPKSPGFRFLPPAFTPPSPVSTVMPSPSIETSTTTSPVATSPLTEEEGPASFEAPPTTAEGSILPSVQKARARHSVRRRPPSRRHRKSSSGEEVGPGDNEVDAKLSSSTGGGVFNEEGQTNAMTPPENKDTTKEEEEAESKRSVEEVKEEDGTRSQDSMEKSTGKEENSEEVMER
ncbi:duboraya isoform 2-T2 [Pholidichthys leucotaenia]